MNDCRHLYNTTTIIVKLTKTRSREATDCHMLRIVGDPKSGGSATLSRYRVDKEGSISVMPRTRLKARVTPETSLPDPPAPAEAQDRSNRTAATRAATRQLAGHFPEDDVWAFRML